MSLKSAPYYWVECDDCGLSAEEGGDYAAWALEAVARDNAYNADFCELEVPGEALQHFCYDCAEKRGYLEEDQ